MGDWYLTYRRTHVSHLRRTVAALSLAGVVVLAGCTSGRTDAPTDEPTTGSPTSEAPASPDPEPSGDATAPAEPTDAPPDPDPTTEPADDRTTVSPLIAYAGPGTDPATIEVAGFVPDVIEEGGTCTATISATGMSVTAPAFADATSTSCGLLVLPTPPAGQTVVLSYSSTASQGTSAPAEVTS